MCFNTRQYKDSDYLEKKFNKAIIEGFTIWPTAHTNGFSCPETPVITDVEPNIIQPYNWGLIPFWSKDDKIRSMTLNAKIETLHEKPSFRNSINKRCLVIADGFFEWQWLDPKGKQKQKFEITLPNEEAFAFAGIYSEWKNPENGNTLKTYSIVTTDAMGIMREIHNSKMRQPVILSVKELQNEWLNKIPVSEFAKIEVDLQAKLIA